MASAPRYKVYVDGVYIAACKYPEEAAMILSGNGHGEIRSGHKKSDTVYTLQDGDIIDSLDAVARTVYETERA